MKVRFDKGFAKTLKKAKSPFLQKEIPKFIKQIEQIDSIKQLNSVKMMKNHPKYYRYRIGSYRVGFKKIDAHTISLIIVAKRADIYKKFP